MTTERVFYYERFGIISVANVSARYLDGIDMRSGEFVSLRDIPHWKTAEEKKTLEQQGRIRRRDGTMHREAW
jgi:hypothetical protein